MAFRKLDGSCINLIEPASIGGGASVDALEAWIQAHRSDVQEALQHDGAIVFRGFDVNTPADFEHVGLSVNPNLATRYPGGAPREQFGKHVWSASETPAPMPISSHCELSYIPRIRPDQIMFCCVSEPESGGETPVANMREVWERLPVGLQKRFEEEEITVVRSFPAEKRYMLDVRRVKVPVTSWPNVLGSADPSKIQKDATEDGVILKFWKTSTTPPVFKWLQRVSSKSGKANLWSVLYPVVAVVSWPLSFLPVQWPLDEFSEQVDASEAQSSTVELTTTFKGFQEVNGKRMYVGLDVFFSEYGWAAESLFNALRTKSLTHLLIAVKIMAGTVLFSSMRFLGLCGRAPLDLRLGQALGPVDVFNVNQAYWKSFYFHQWRRGDVLVLNNSVCSHGRMPFTGPRKILTAFG